MTEASIGIIEVKVKLYLESDVTEAEARNIVGNCNYSFVHRNIQDTEIVSDDIAKRIEDRQNEIDELMAQGEW